MPTLIRTLMLTSLALLAGCKTQEIVQSEPGPVPAGAFVQAWSAPVDVGTVKGLYYDQDLVCVYGAGNVVAGYDLAGGLSFRSTVAPKNDVIGPPIVQADRVIFPASSSLRVLSRNGVLREPIVLTQPIRSGGAINGEVVYCGIDSAQGGRIAAIDISREIGHVRWTRIAGGVVDFTPQIHENVVYFATKNGRVIALTTDPVLLWSRTDEMDEGIFQVDGQILAPIRVDVAGVYVPSTDTKLYALDPTTGRIRWEYFAGQAVIDAPQPSNDLLYQYLRGQGLIAIDKKNPGRYPKAVWTAPDALRALADDDQNTYVLLNSGAIAALDRKTGERKFVTERSDFVYVAPNLNARNTRIYAITSDGKLMAIEPVLKPGTVGRLVRAD